MSQTAQPSKPTTMQVGTILDDALEPSPLAKLRRRVFRNHSFLIGTLVLLLIFGVWQKLASPNIVIIVVERRRKAARQRR